MSRSLLSFFTFFLLFSISDDFSADLCLGGFRRFAALLPFFFDFARRISFRYMMLDIAIPSLTQGNESVSIMTIVQRISKITFNNILFKYNFFE